MKRASAIHTETTKKAVALLRKHGLKVTAGRSAVLGELMHTHEPLSIEMLTGRVKGTNIVTLYRILEQFVKKGIVYQADFRHGKAYFEYQPNHHHHVTCTQCGYMESITACIEVQQEKALSRAEQFAGIESHVLEFFGICKKCKTQTS